MSNKVEKLYRVIGLDVFLDMTQRKELCFVHPSLWDDPHEGLLFEALKDPQYQPLIREHALKNWGSTPGAGIALLGNFPQFSRALYAQCWSKLEESDALWRIYSFGNRSIRIETDTAKLDELGITYLPVEYEDLDLKAHLVKVAEQCLVNQSPNFSCALRYKRKAFEHEQEVRLFSSIDGNAVANTLSDNLSRLFAQLEKEGRQPTASEALLIKTEFGKREAPIPPRIKRISYAKVKDFIKSVRVHPLADDWYVETVKTYCKNNKIRFAGKSKLYESAV